MSKNSNKTFHYTALGLRFLEKILSSQFNVTGIENLPDQPILFVSNHFTRSETFIIPYVIYKHTKRQVRCLADEGLFVGALGRFIRRIGALSTKNIKRDDIIISDLISGKNDWMIYPEGSMIKGKQIYNEGRFLNQTSHGLTTTKTGSAVLGLKSELYRKDFIDAKKKGRDEVVQYYKTKYDLEYDPALEQLTTYVVPINITYYPIRPGINILQKFADKFLKAIPKQISEELEIEGNLILSANVDINFGQAINLAQYLKSTRDSIYKIPIIKSDLRNNLILRYLKYNLTAKFMAEIYTTTRINLDHLFAGILHHYKKDRINIDHFKRLIYLSALTIKKTYKFQINYSIEEENLFKILIDEPHYEFDDILRLITSQNIISESKDGQNYIIDRANLQKKYQFNEVRLENTLQVIKNEFLLLETANNIIRRNIMTSAQDITKKVFDELSSHDLKNYKNDYKKYYNPNLSKEEIIGAPFFLDVKNEIAGNEKIGILVCHGYQSSPKETEGLANYLNNLGFRVYAVRLKGHGTSPENIKDVTWQDWYDSMQRGYAILKTICSKIIIVGFSTGGLLALLSAARKNKPLGAVVGINSAFELKDIRAKMVPGINIWNDLLEKFKITKGQFEYVENISENPSVNYSRNYLKGVEQLGLLMNESWSHLGYVTAPALIIHAVKDPVIEGTKGKKVIEKIKSPIKKLVELDMNNHIIIVSKNSEKVFAEIKEFLRELNLLSNDNKDAANIL